MLGRSQISTSTLKLYRKDGARSLLFFVHGLNGSNGPEYWGRLPDFLGHDRQLDGYDMAFWQYPTHQRPSPRLWELWQRKRLPDVSTIADSCASELTSLIKKHRYSNVGLIGHSMGGLILFEYLRRQLGIANETNVNGVAVLGSPFRKSIIAWLVSFSQLRSNRQIFYLAKDNELSLTEGLRHCKAFKIQAWYIASLEDDVVASHPIYSLFDKHEVVSGPHLWMPLLSSVHDSGYQAILRYVYGLELRHTEN